MSCPFALTLLSSLPVEMLLWYLVGAEGILLSQDTADLEKDVRCPLGV